MELILTVMLLCLSLWIFRDHLQYHKIVKIIILFVISYIISWSIFNWLFYLNMIVLHEFFNHPLLEAIFIAINLTDEFSTGVYYGKIYFDHFFGLYDLTGFISDFEKAMQPTIDLYNSLSDTETIINIIFKLLPFI